MAVNTFSDKRMQWDLFSGFGQVTFDIYPIHSTLNVESVSHINTHTTLKQETIFRKFNDAFAESDELLHGRAGTKIPYMEMNWACIMLIRNCRNVLYIQNNPDL